MVIATVLSILALVAVVIYVIISSRSEIYATLRIGSANFKNGIINLDATILQPITKFHLCSVQELEMPNERWDKPEQGVIETFGPRAGTRNNTYLLLSSATQFQEKYQHSFGGYFNPNFNFQWNSYKRITFDNEEGRTETKGIIYVPGILGGIKKLVVGFIHGIWGKERYDSTINIKGVREFFKTMKYEYPTHDLILIGDFNLRHSIIKRARGWECVLGRKLNYINLKESLLTCTDKDGFANPDHIITTFPIKSFRTIAIDSDHMGLDIELKIPGITDFDLIGRQKRIVILEKNE